MDEKTKTCSKCNTQKPLSQYWKHKTGKFGVRSECIECTRKMNKKWREKNSEYLKEVKRKDYQKNGKLRYEQNKEEILKRQRERYHANSEAKKYYRIKYIYGIEREEYDEMIKDGCNICGSNEKLHIDHCHKTGKVRGILCNDCNLGLGRFRDNKKLLQKAIDYLENFGMGLGKSKVVQKDGSIHSINKQPYLIGDNQ